MGDHSSSPSRRRKIKPLARELGVAPNALRKYERSDSPPKRQERPRTRLLDRYETHIDELIRSTPKIAAVRIGSYLRQNVDAPGYRSQFDFSPMTVCLAGVLVVVQVFVLRLSYSGRFMARASMRCDQPSLFAGLLACFTAFGGLTRTSIFDNASTVVKRILRGRNREENEAFFSFRGA